MKEYWHEECKQPLSQVPTDYLKDIIAGINLTSADGADLDIAKRLAAIFLAERVS